MFLDAVLFWTAVAERSGDTAFPPVGTSGQILRTRIFLLTTGRAGAIESRGRSER